jgi:hypothetical protein
MIDARRTVKRIFWALLWIGAGTLILLANYGVVPYEFTFHRDWPAILVLIGVSKLIDAIG